MMMMKCTKWRRPRRFLRTTRCISTFLRCPIEAAIDALVSWIKKKIGPAVQNVTTAAEAEKILTAENTVVLGFFDSLVGADSQELAAASKLEDGVNFYQIVSADVTKLFHIVPKAQHPSLVLLKKEAEKLSHFDGQFTKSNIIDFVFANKLPLVSIFTRENAPNIFDNPIKKQLLLFATSKDSDKILPIFQEAAKLFKGKLIFVYVEIDNEDVGKPVSDYFGVSGDGPNVLAYSGNDDAKKFVLDGEVTVDSIKVSTMSDKALLAFVDHSIVDKIPQKEVFFICT